MRSERVAAEPHLRWLWLGNRTDHRIGELELPCVQLESQEVLQGVRLRFETWGKLNAQANNAVVVCHALTGDAHAGAGESGPGWWSDLIGPGKLLDTQRFFVVSSNVLGGCGGTTGSASVAWDGRPYGLRFPLISVRDMVAVQLQLVDALGVDEIAMVIGGSLGGMQVWEWACMAPERVREAVVVAAHAAFTPLAMGYNAVMRQAITADPAWQQGNYYGTGQQPETGVSIARQIGLLTYRASELYQERFGRKLVDERFSMNPWEAFTKPQYQVESYLDYNGRKFVDRFDSNTYLYLMRAMDGHDIGRNRGGVSRALTRIKSRLTLVGIRTDYLYPVAEMQATAREAVAVGVDCRYMELNSPHGHDAFLIEQDALAKLIEQSREGRRV
ncbi:homoserine O-acetyltransferase [Alicyclobacillaceae bacterium I2511]|nr:homoserine O-acetyltransferase [Alicyclobacillaceae bacterium I2511]